MSLLFDLSRFAQPLARTLLLAHALVACSAPIERSTVEPERAVRTALPLASVPVTDLLGADHGAVLQRAPIAALHGVEVALATGDRMRVDGAAAAAFARHRALAGELAGASHALYDGVETIEEFIETEDRVVLVARTRFVVDDPSALRGASPRVGTLRLRPQAAPRLTEFDSQQREWFAAFKQRMLAEPASHPLGAAARKGDEALWAAALAGKGERTITTRASVLTAGLPRNGNTIMVPSIVDGAHDYTQMRPQSAPFSAGAEAADGASWGGVQTQSGKRTGVSEFVNGYLVADDVRWEETWDFSIGHVAVDANAHWAAGIRAPIEVEGTITPSEIRQFGGGADGASEFTTDLRVDVFDADADFYKDAGVAPGELYEGQELVLNAGASVHVEAEVMGVIDAEGSFGRSFDFGQNFAPPFGGCGTACGVEVWIPPSWTRTQIDILGVVHGEAQVGFLVEGEGEVDLAYESLYDGDVTRSRRGNAAGRDKHLLSFDDTDAKSLTTELAPLAEPGFKRFGYRVSDLLYTWHLAVRPGIRGEVEIDGGFFEWGTEIEPIWFDFARFNLGTVELPRLDGTRAEREHIDGIKHWDQLVASDAPPAQSYDAGDRPIWEPTEEEQESAFGAFCLAQGTCPVRRDAGATYVFHDGELQGLNSVEPLDQLDPLP